MCGVKYHHIFLFAPFFVFSWGRLDIFSLSEEWFDPLPSPHHTTHHHHPRSLTVRLPVSHQCSPFFSAAVTESPALFPVVKARCSVTVEGGVVIAEGEFAEGREVHFLSLTPPKLALTRAQH